uniref:Mucin-21-like isoform X2 n=1 Tax=Saccoglossus kowalevskii TaxID=10224 RepID=A0ABM0LWU5_SACKO|nr:PREDICTED: mucin-21-like isoform X2 [Saccoglossus kowalevskii]
MGGSRLQILFLPGLSISSIRIFCMTLPWNWPSRNPRRKRARKRDASLDGEEQPKRQRRKRKKADDTVSMEGENNSIESGSIIGSIDEQTNKLLEEASLISESDLCGSHESNLGHHEGATFFKTETTETMLPTPPDMQSSSPLDAVTMATISSDSPHMLTSPTSLNSPASQLPTSNEVPSGPQHPLTPSNSEHCSNNNNNTVPKNQQNSEVNSLCMSTEIANHISSCPSSVNSISNDREDLSCPVFDGMLSRPDSSCSVEGSHSNMNCELEDGESITPNSASIQNNGLCHPNTTVFMCTAGTASVTSTYSTSSTAGLSAGVVCQQAPINSGQPPLNNNQPEEAHPLEILQAQIQLQRQQFNISDTRPLPFKNQPKAPTSHKTKGTKTAKAANQVDVETLLAEEDSTWYMPTDAPKEPTNMLPWEHNKKTSDKGQSVDPNQVDRRTLHKISEQKRRESLKHSIDVLKRAVPDCRDLADQSQQNVLLRVRGRDRIPQELQQQTCR